MKRSWTASAASPLRVTRSPIASLSMTSPPKAHATSSPSGPSPLSPMLSPVRTPQATRSHATDDPHGSGECDTALSSASASGTSFPLAATPIVTVSAVTPAGSGGTCASVTRSLHPNNERYHCMLNCHTCLQAVPAAHPPSVTTARRDSSCWRAIFVPGTPHRTTSPSSAASTPASSLRGSPAKGSDKNHTSSKMKSQLRDLVLQGVPTAFRSVVRVLELLEHA